MKPDHLHIPIETILMSVLQSILTATSVWNIAIFDTEFEDSTVYQTTDDTRTGWVACCSPSVPSVGSEKWETLILKDYEALFSVA